MKISAIVAALAVAAPWALAQKTVDVVVGAGKKQVYSPNALTINVGDSVRFTWEGGPHSVTQAGEGNDPCGFVPNGVDSGNKNATETYGLKFNTAGKRFFACKVGQHCKNGMQMTIDVLAAGGAPAGAPPTTGAPGASADQPVVIQVGANGLTFEPKDVTVAPGTWVKWEFQGQHNVKQVAAADSCDPQAGGFASETLPKGQSFMQQFTQPGDNFYVCTFNQHCQKGMKGSVKVQAGATNPTPGAAAVPGQAAKTHIIKVGEGGKKFNPPEVTAAPGDTVQWEWVAGPHNVMSVPDAGSCIPNGVFAAPKQSTGTFSRVIGANETGTTVFFACTLPGHCEGGMKGSIKVDANAAGNNATGSALPGTRAKVMFGAGVAVAGAWFML